MTDSNYTDITFVLDRSGSMASVVNDTVGGFATFVKDHQALSGNVRMTLVKFDHEYLVDYTSLPVNDVPTLNFQPRGRTALRDAVGRAIVEAGERFVAMPESKRPGKVIFVILTDGYENASREFTGQQVKVKIEEQQDRWNWQFMYLGANQDAITVGTDMGINAGQTMTYAGTGQGTRSVFDKASKSSVAYSSGASGQSLPSFSDEDRDDVAPGNPKNK